MVMYEAGFSYGSLWKIIHGQLHASQVSARWTPFLPTPLQRQTRLGLFRQMLVLLEQNVEYFFDCLVDKDKWPMYLHNLESIEVSTE